MKIANVIEFVVVIGILTLAAYLRLHDVAQSPGWYTDEGTHINIAQNILRGKTQYLAVDQSTLLFARLPLFEYLLAGAMHLFEESMATLRSLTGLLGVLSTLTLYAAVRLSQPDRMLAMFAMLALAIYPQAVLYSRFGFSYNLLAPLVILTALGLVKYWQSERRRWLLLTVLAIGIGLTSDLMIGSLIPIAIFIIIARHPSDIIWSLLIVALPFGVYSALMLWHAPQAFLFDLNYTLFRLGNLSWRAQIQNVIHNYAVLLEDTWILIGIVCLLIIRDTRLRFIASALLLGAIVVMGRTVALYHLSFYYLIPLLPLIALGWGAVLRYGIPYIAASLHQGWHELSGHKHWMTKSTSYLIASILVLTPIAHSINQLFNDVRFGFHTSIDPFLIEPESAVQVAEYINSHRDEATVVIASPAIAWLLNANVADFQMSIAYQGIETVHMPGDVDSGRFAFDPGFQRAEYVIVDKLWHNWGTIHMPQVKSMLAQIETWPQVIATGQVVVYQNPIQQ